MSTVPKPAASLILCQELNGQHHFLMGRRSAAHRFMPNVYVFPGGRVDLTDEPERNYKFDILPQARLDGLAAEPDVFLCAALRELEEETGYAAGDISVNSDLKLLARAITPEPSKIRFDTLFFLAEVKASTVLPAVESDELEDVGWYRFDQIREFALASITQSMLGHIKQTLEDGGRNSFFAFI